MYNKDLDITISTINGDIAHTCGNVSAIVFNDFKRHFPKDYFKYEFVNTKLAFRQFTNIKRVVDFKRQKPLVAMQPKLIVDNSEFNIDMWHRLYGTSLYDIIHDNNNNAVKFFRDEAHDAIIDFFVERMRMSFNFTIMVSTEYQQYNVMAHMKSSFRIDHPYYLEEMQLETLIPDGIIKQLSEDSGIPIIDETLGVKPFLDYINEISNIPVIYGLQGATGKYRFFMVVTTNIWMNYNNFNISDGEKDGQISDHFPLEIQLDVEFNYPSAFYYLSKHKRKEISNIDSEDGLLGSDRNIEMHLTFNRTLIPERDEFNNQLYISCVVECDDLEEDSVDISSLFTEEQAKVCLQMIMDGKNPNPLIRFIVYEDEFKMHPDRIYVDWIAKELRLSNTKKNRSYRIAVYINNRLFNDYLLRHHDYTNKIKGGN